MKKIYDKSPLAFALIWIGIYCVLQSLGNIISKKIGIYESAGAVFALVQAVYIFLWLRKYGLMKTFGLNRPLQPGKRMLFYIPLILICTRNLWNGLTVNLKPSELCFHIVLMLCVGFLEELLFRGFLFEAMAKDNMKTAVVVSSVTFGIGHIVNLFNGSGMGTAEVIMQIVMAVAVGFLFVTIYLRSGSLIPCIAAHVVINISGAFANENGLTTQTTVIQHGLLLVIILAYLLVLSKTAPAKRK